MTSKTAIRRDDGGLPEDPWALAEELAIEVSAETGREIADLVLAAKADIHGVKALAADYRRNKRRSNIRLPGDDTPEEELMAYITRRADIARRP